MGGRFIVVEGVDGSGSTTQGRLLVERLCRVGKEAVGTCEPSVGPIGVFIRSVLEKRLRRAEGELARFDWTSMALLFSADRRDHNVNLIAPALAGGQWVICDRYVLSSLLYQTLTSPEPTSALPWVQELNRLAIVPDLTVVLDVPAEIAAQRRVQRGGEPELFDENSLQTRLAEGYRTAEPSGIGVGPLVHIDGSREPTEVHAQIWKALRQLDPSLPS